MLGNFYCNGFHMDVKIPYACLRETCCKYYR